MAGLHDEIKEPAAAQGESHEKKSYSKPELIVHGTVEKITEEQKGTGRQDGGSGIYTTHSR